MHKERIILLGLDAFDADVAAGMATAGELPTLARLLDGAARCPVNNPFGLFVGALWFSFASMVRPDRHGFHCWEGIDVASYERRPTALPDDEYPPFWQRLADHGLRVAAVDVPHAHAHLPINGLHVAEWGVHDRHYGFHTSPAARAAGIEARHGHHPALGLTPHEVREFAPDDEFERAGLLRTADETRRFVAGLRSGIAKKADLLSDLMAEEDWDLFLGVFGESHAAGHHLWHLHDPAHPLHDRALCETLGGDPLLQIYRDLDGAVGRLIAEAPQDAVVLVHLSHGMGPHYDGVHLLDEILERLEASYAEDRPRHRRRTAALRLVSPLKPALRSLAQTLRIPSAVRDPVARRLRGDLPAIRARQRFFVEPNNNVHGGIRFNLKGREPHGRVDPSELDSLCERLRHDLLELVNGDTGEPVVVSVGRTDHYHRRTPSDQMPDLLVEWARTSLVESVTSPRIGTIRDFYVGWRTGDHKPSGLMLATGPGMHPGTLFDEIEVEDIGASIAARFGMDFDDVDGRAADWLKDTVQA